jgi:ubiquinone biosynthesis protein
MIVLKLGLNFKLLWRLVHILCIVVWYGIRDITGRIARIASKAPGVPEKNRDAAETDFPSPRMVRFCMERLGPCFIKLGQLLSTRDDILPSEFVNEFKKLQDQVRPLLVAAISSVVERELGKPLTVLFDRFNPESIAAASVAQVHEAWLFSGERIAVKVIRPDILPLIRKDIRLMYYLARTIENRSERGRMLGVVNLVKEFERTIFNELDMFVEAGNIERFRNNFKHTRELHICRVYREFTSRSVLVMEYIDGVKVDQVEAIKAAGIDPGEIGLIGLRSFSRQLMEFGFFHADPHPGNTIVMADGRVSIIDFGLMSYVDDEMMRELANLCLGFADHDYDQVMDALNEMGLLDEKKIRLKEFKADLKEVSEPFYGRSLLTISVREVYEKVMQLVLKHRVTMPRNLLLILKTFVQNEAIGKKLGSTSSILQVARPYAEKLIRQRFEPDQLFKRFNADARKMAGHLQSMPANVSKLLANAADNRFSMEIRHTTSSRLHQSMERGINRLIVGIIIAASTIAAALILNSSQKLFNIDLAFAGFPEISLTGLLGVSGYVIATFLGLWLIISILRSGRL